MTKRPIDPGTIPDDTTVPPTDPNTIPDDTTVPPPPADDAKQDDDATESETV